MPLLARGTIGSTNERYIVASASDGGHQAHSHLDAGCADDTFWKVISRRSSEWRQKRGGEVHSGEPNALCGDWISYILTTANTWKGPIEDFELIVERDPGDLVTFCWDGPVEKIAPDRFRAKALDFRPTKELTVYFCPPVDKLP